MKKMKQIILASFIAASLMTGCKSEAKIEDKATKDNPIETVEEVEGLKIYGQGCEIYQEGETFEKNGMIITVNSSRLTKQKGDCITFETSEDFVTTFVEEQNNGTFIYNLSFKREGKYNFKASVEKFDVVTQIEVNNTLYDQLKVA